MKKVRCPKYETCGNKDCMHYHEHVPLVVGANGTTCDWEKSYCLLVGMDTQCEAVKRTPKACPWGYAPLWELVNGTDY